MSIFDQMLSRYDNDNQINNRNAVYEVMQQIALAGLHRSGFFEKCAFYGGTCLRIFHGLNRFSEDMDFSLIRIDDSFQFETYFPALVNEFAAAGRDVEIRKIKVIKFKTMTDDCDAEGKLLPDAQLLTKVGKFVGALN